MVMVLMMMMTEAEAAAEAVEAAVEGNRWPHKAAKVLAQRLPRPAAAVATLAALAAARVRLPVRPEALLPHRRVGLATGAAGVAMAVARATSRRNQTASRNS